jgi:hypothetical protein
MDKKIQKDEKKANVMEEKVVSVKSDAGVGIMKHSDGRIEKRKF